MTESYNTQFSIRVDWGELDLFGHVNNVAFFRYIQSARVNYCESIGLTSLNNNDQLSFMVASSQCQFKKPLLYPNQITVFSKVDWVKNTSFQISYRILDEARQVVAEGQDVLVVYDHRQKTKVPISDTLRKLIEAGEKTAF